jgi:N-acetylglucosaminyldiphosphoundecaprenol N-acetyl-beta-D-mannosaminyltransferase
MWASSNQLHALPAGPFASARHRMWQRRVGFICATAVHRCSAAALKRAIDLTFALLLLAVFAPVVLAVCARWAVRCLQRPVRLWISVSRQGRSGETFQELQFHPESAGQGALIRRIPALWNVLSGDMSLVGPRPATLGSSGWYPNRFDVRPGLVSLWWVRYHANIAWAGELVADRDYLESHTTLGDLGILLRAAFISLLRRGDQVVSGRLQIAGLPIDNLTTNQAIEWILDRVESGIPAQVSFINAHCVNVAFENAKYRTFLQESDLNLSDGIGLRIAAQIVGTAVRENVNGTDLFPELCCALSGTGKSLFLLGGQPGVVAKVAEWMRLHYPGTKIAGVRDGFFGPQDEPAVVEEIRNSGANILLVAMGVPRQEIWIAEHLRACGVQVAMGVGGLFDFYSGRIPRAPMWLRELGFEWLFRFLQEPVRLFERYLVGNWIFLWRIVAAKSCR